MKKVRLIGTDDEATDGLMFLPEMKLLVGKTAWVLEETDIDVTVDLGDPAWGWHKTWVEFI